MFPALGEKVYGKPLVYLDNAATTQRPLSVVEKWRRMALERNANIHRAVHFLSSEATAEYEKRLKKPFQINLQHIQQHM